MATVAMDRVAVSDRESTTILLVVGAIVVLAVWFVGRNINKAVDLAGGAGAVVGSAVGGAGHVASTAIGGTGDFLQRTRDDVSAGLGTVFDTNAQIATHAIGGAGELIQRTRNDVSAGLGNFWGGAGQTFNDIKGGLGHTYNRILDGLLPAGTNGNARLSWWENYGR